MPELSSGSNQRGCKTGTDRHHAHAEGPENQRAFEHFKSGFEQRFIAVPGICQFFGRYRRGEIRS